jgi:hypothetical protein
VVASVTGVISYTHVYDLTVSLHQPVMVARLMPFGVDGLIVVGSVVLLLAARARRGSGGSASSPAWQRRCSPMSSPGCAGGRSLPDGPECLPRRSRWPRSSSNDG